MPIKKFIDGSPCLEHSNFKYGEKFHDGTFMNVNIICLTCRKNWTELEKEISEDCANGKHLNCFSSRGILDKDNNVELFEKRCRDCGETFIESIPFDKSS